MQLTVEQQHKVENNIGLVHHVIKLYVHNPGNTGIYSYEDLFQIECIGLCKAANEYKQGDAQFSTYACTAIRNQIYNALEYASKRKAVELPALNELRDVNISAFSDGLRTAELEAALKQAQNSMSGVAYKGIDAILLLAKGYTCKEIGRKYGTNDKNITAWISKARKHLRGNALFLSILHADGIAS